MALTVEQKLCNRFIRHGGKMTPNKALGVLTNAIVDLTNEKVLIDIGAAALVLLREKENEE